MKRIGVLVSGRGTNLQALIDATERGDIPCEITVVISNKKNAYALERARAHGIEATHLPRKGRTPEEYDEEIVEILRKRKVGIVVLAGYMKILTPVVIRAYENHILNIHPSLLPSFGGVGFYGEKVHRAVLEYGCKFSGCTVHIVTEDVDSGPVVTQKCVPVLDDDTPETLASRVLEKEHEALVEAVKYMCEDRVMIEGRRVKIISP